MSLTNDNESVSPVIQLTNSIGQAKTCMPHFIIVSLDFYHAIVDSGIALVNNHAIQISSS